MLLFKPPFLFRNRHFQTIWPTLVSIPNTLQKSEENVLVNLDDGDQLLLKINRAMNSSDAVLLVHGLEGSSESRYMVQVADVMLKNGFNVVRMNLRNCGGTETLAKKLYNAGMSNDLKQVLQFLNQYKWENINIVGFSLGANLVGKFCGENDNNNFNVIKKVLLVSPPLDLHKSVQVIQKGFSKLYNQHFTKLLKQKFLLKCRLYPSLYQPESLVGVTDLYSFDDQITGPSFGFKDAVDYYINSSCRSFISKSNFSIQILISLDDPIVDAQECLSLKNENQSHIELFITQKGGHVGFYGYDNLTTNKPINWLANFIANRLC